MLSVPTVLIIVTSGMKTWLCGSSVVMGFWGRAMSNDVIQERAN